MQESASGRYHVYVHYYSDDGLGATTATVRLWLFSGTPHQVYREFTRRLNATNDFWYVATIDMPSGTINVPATPTSVTARPAGTASLDGFRRVSHPAKKH